MLKIEKVKQEMGHIILIEVTLMIKTSMMGQSFLFMKMEKFFIKIIPKIELIQLLKKWTCLVSYTGESYQQKNSKMFLPSESMQMAEPLLDNLKIIRDTAMESINGLLEIFIRVSSKITR